MTIEYAHDIEVTVEIEDGAPLILIDFDGGLIDLTPDDAQTFRDMLDRAIETARDHDCPCGDCD